MGRSPRIEFEGAVYHIMSRGNRGASVFRDDRDCEQFLDTLEEACGRTGWHVHAFALSDKPWMVDEAWASIRRGWCFGDEGFRKEMQEKLGRVVKGKRRSSYSGYAMPEHDITAAERLLKQALEQMGLSRRELSGMSKGDWRKKG